MDADRKRGCGMTATCRTCGGPAHPRLYIRQAVHVPPPRRNLWPSLVVGGVFLGIAIAEGLIPALVGVR